MLVARKTNTCDIDKFSAIGISCGIGLTKNVVLEANSVKVIEANKKLGGGINSLSFTTPLLIEYDKIFWANKSIEPR